MGIGALLKSTLKPTEGTIILPMAPAGVDDRVVLDTTLRRTHSDDADVSTMPVEGTKSYATDNVRMASSTLVVSGVLADTPLLTVGGLAKPNRARDGYNRLLAYMDTGTSLLVTTDIRAHKQMIMRSVTVDEDVSTGDAIFVTLGFVKAQIIMLKTGEVKFDAHASMAGVGGTTDMGQQSLWETAKETVKGWVPWL